MATDQRPRRREDFRIAVLCALPLEYNAATLAFDEFFDEDGDKFGRARGDPNKYTTGRIGKYNVVMALLPGMGTVSSASVTASFRSSYTELKLALLVGICGGVPSPGTEKEILLGDVVISKTVVQYDFGRQNPHRFTTKDTLSDSLGRPNKDIRSLLASLETERTFERLERRTAEILTDIQQSAAQASRKRKRNRYPYPGAAQDRLFSPNYVHRHRDDADCGCDDTWICDTAPDASCIEMQCGIDHLVPRERLEMKMQLEREGNDAEAQEPHILIGNVGSGNAVMKSGAHRDEIAQRYDLIAFEMEAAGAWEEMPCVVIKGVCDYADSHKNKKWQTFAAATAASSMKALLELYIQTDSPGNSRIEFTTQRINEILTWISKEPYEQHHTLNKSEVLEGTGKWLLEDEVFHSWKNSEASSILWLHGIPGSGKSKLTSIVVEEALQSSPAATVYFYCSRNPAEPGRSDPTSIVSSIARQLAMPQPDADILDAAVEAYKSFEKKAFASQSLTLGESEGLIHKLLESYRGQTITLIIDAMDECNRDTRQDLLNFLVSLLEAPTTMKVFVSSRDDRDIVYELDKYENLYLSSERNSNDIELFVRSEISRLVENGSLLRGSSRKEELRSKIIKKLSSDAHGILHIQELRRQATDAAIEERLCKMPGTLEGLYREILATIENRDAAADREMARNAFIWLLCAQEQLKSSVFLGMVSRTKDGPISTIPRDHLLELCNNMVLFDKTLDAFRFSHLSVREFLESEPSYRMTAAHALAAEQCILHLADTPPILMPATPLLEYSIFFWADHAKQADHEERQSRLSLILSNFFSGEQDPYSPFSRWYDRICSHTDHSIQVNWDQRYKFEAVLSYPPSIMLVICMFDLSGVLSPERWRDLAQTRPRTLDGATHEELAIRYGSIRIIQRHFDAGIPFSLTLKHVEMAARSEVKGVCMMSFLLERFAGEILLTQKVFKAAVLNEEYGDIIITHFLEKRGHEIEITGDIVRAAVSNEEYGDIIMTRFLEKRGHEIEISGDIVRTAVKNRRKAVEITSLLLKQYKNRISITPDIVLAAIQNGADVLKVLLDERGDEIEISTDLILSATEECWNSLPGFLKPVLSLLLEERRDQIHITEDFILSIVPTQACTKDVMELLLDECDIQFTWELIDAVNDHADGAELMTLLLDRLEVKPEISDYMMELIITHFSDVTLRKFIDLWGYDLKITNRIVKLAVGNKCYGTQMMELLFFNYANEIHITEDIVEAIFENNICGPCMMSFLLCFFPDRICISEKFTKRAVQSDSDMLERIFSYCGDEMHVTDEIIELCSAPEDKLRFIRERKGYAIQVTEKLLVEAADQRHGITTGTGGLLEFLLDQRIKDVRLTEDVVRTAAGNPRYGFGFITLLIDRCGDDILITNKILEAAASNPGLGDQVMKALLSWGGVSLPIAENVVEAAIKNSDISHKVMQVLLTARGDRISIPEKVLVLAGTTGRACEVIQILFENRGDNIQITEEAVSIAVQNSWRGAEILEIFLEKYADDVPLTDGIIGLAARNEGCGDKIVSLLLKKRRGDILITGEVLLAAAHNPKCGHSIMAAIFDTPGIFDHEGGQLCEALDRSLYDASRLGHMETVQALLNNGADVNAKGYEYGSSLQVASFSGHHRVVQMLLQNAADVNASGGFFGYALQAAASCGHLEIIHMLLQNGADVNARGGAYDTALQAASSDGNEEVVELLLKRNPNVDAQGGMNNGALYAASLGGHTTVVRMLLENNADVNTQGGQFGNALQASSFKGHLESAKMLLEFGADASCDNGFYGGSIQAASAGGHVEILALLHGKYGAGLDYSNRRFGRTALSYAAEGGHSSAVQLLLADPNVRPSSEDYMGRTPLFFAAQKGHVEIVLTLVRRDPSVVDIKDHYGSTPLSIATRSGHIAVVRTLLATCSNSIDLDSRDCFGRTPLSWARKHSLAEMSSLFETAKGGDLPPEALVLGETDSQLSSRDTANLVRLPGLVCDICTSSISEGSACDQCSCCSGGGSPICKDCCGDGGLCLQELDENCTRMRSVLRFLEVNPSMMAL